MSLEDSTKFMQAVVSGTIINLEQKLERLEAYNVDVLEGSIEATFLKGKISATLEIIKDLEKLTKE